MSKATIHISGIIGNEDGQFSLKNVIAQYKAFEDVTEAEFIIDSVGGSVEVGESIGKYIENLEIPTTTIAVKAYSIAAHIFMSGKTRLVEDTAKPLMIHLPLIPEFGGRSNDFQAAADFLKGLEKKFTDFYAAKIDLDKDTIYSLLSAESFLSGQEAVSMGFATGIRTQDFKAVAFHDETQTKIKDMTNEKFLTKLANALGFSKEDKPEAVALQLTDSNGDVVDFPELEEGDTPKEGDKANDAEGTPIEGERIMPTLDNATVKFEAGAVTEIVPADSEENEDEAPAEDAEANEEPESNEDELDIQAVVDQIVKAATEAVQAQMQENIDAQAVEITDLKKLIGSKEVEIKAEETSTKNKSNKNTNYLR